MKMKTRLPIPGSIDFLFVFLFVFLNPKYVFNTLIKINNFHKDSVLLLVIGKVPNDKKNKLGQQRFQFTRVLVRPSKHHIMVLLKSQQPEHPLHTISVYLLLTAFRVPDAQVSGSLSSSFDGLGLYSPLGVRLSAIWCAGT